MDQMHIPICTLYSDWTCFMNIDTIRYLYGVILTSRLHSGPYAIVVHVLLLAVSSLFPEVEWNVLVFDHVSVNEQRPTQYDTMTH